MKESDMLASERRVFWLLAFLVFIFLLIAYSNSLFAPFTLDDTHSFVIEPKVLQFTFSPDGFAGLAKTKFGLARYLPMLSFALDLRWGGGSIIAFHITNIAIHLLAALALFFMFKSLFGLARLSRCQEECAFSNTLVTFGSVAIAGIWALNPVQTNAVTYLVQRMTSMAALFYFLAMFLYLKGRISGLQGGGRFQSFSCFLGALLFWLCALLSKEISVTLPLMIILVEGLLFGGQRLQRIAWRHRIVCALLVLGVLLVFWHRLPGFLDGYNRRHFTFDERLLTELRIVVSYIFLLLLPLPRFLTLEHDPSLSTSLLTPPTTLGSALFILVLLVVAWRLRKKQPLISFGILWFFINLLIESTVIPLELMFEHRAYLPSAGLFLAIFLAGRELVRRFPVSGKWHYEQRQQTAILVSALVILLSFLSLATYYRNVAWRDSVSLYRDCLLKAPNKPRVHGNLAKALAEVGRHRESIAESEKALALGRRGYEVYWVAAANIISSLSRSGDNQTALARAQEFIDQAQPWELNKAYALFVCNLGNIFLEEGDFQSALEKYFEGLQFCLNYDIPYTSIFEKSIVNVWNLGRKEKYVFKPIAGVSEKEAAELSGDELLALLLFDLGQDEMALQYCQKALDRNSGSKTALEVVEKIEKIKSANRLQQHRGSIREKYFNHFWQSRFNFWMAAAYGLMKVGRYGSLVEFILDRAEKLQPENVDIHLLRSWLRYKQHNYETALAEVDKGLTRDPKYARLWVNRGIYALAVHRYAEALAAFRKAGKLYPGFPAIKKLETMIAAAERGLLRQRKKSGDLGQKGVGDE
jgi:tetratricopeptide (TPR) repeat protein